MLNLKLKLLLATLLTAFVTAHDAAGPPHLSQAWVANSIGDGLPGQAGKESYIYEGCKKTSDTCMNGHVFDYGANNCIKYEVDRGFDSKYSGTYYVSCDAVDCCKSGNGLPDLKKWDIGQATSKIVPDKITYLGKKDTTELNNVMVKDADVWSESLRLPFTRQTVNYTYFITTNGTDVITHRIDFDGGQQATGSILYGQFEVQHNLSEFRGVFEPPAACLKRNVLTCPTSKTQEWDAKYFKQPFAEPETVCKATEYCCPEAKKCLSPTSTSCLSDIACADGQVCCPLTKICVVPGADCTSPCSGSDEYCCPDAKKCLTPTQPGVFCDPSVAAFASTCNADEVCCPLTHLCVKPKADCVAP